MARAHKVDPIELAIFRSAFHSIAEEMGATLRRTAFSPNIKERRDYSCAVFDGAGQVIAMGDHMPVHLGSMPMSVKAAVKALELDPGDIAILNDPYAGGTHLPDITMVLPVYVHGSKTRATPTRATPAFYVASRAHHADVGGTYPGSMGLCREIYQEGIRIPPVKIARAGEIDRNIMALLLCNVRTAVEREGDLTSQIGACRVGAQRLAEMTAKYGLARVRRNMRELLDYSERLVRAELAKLPAGEFTAEDFMDDDGVNEGAIRIRVTLRIDPRRRRAEVDFTGTDPQVAGSINAVEAITYSATYYVFRCLLGDDVPATAGIMRPIELTAPAGTIVNARPPAAVAGGNVETSQRTVDVLMRALAQAAPERVPAASAGTMTNVTIGGMDPRSGKPFAYYETTAGGMGARPGLDGVSGIHTHMTNSLNTPVEALEYAYPFRVRRYGYRRGSGGQGKYRGGDGLVREIELLADSQVTILADRRKFPPYGLAGGEAGATGKATLVRRDGQIEELQGKCNREAKAGDVVRIETPGGGGWGKKQL
ncbi:MAG: hydantoinase B/oxoprolinase family protein [Acidobacteriia bacterium]|nr:hydantoinase B/oxoprolinase family protein [Terriglobia bacterium]